MTGKDIFKVWAPVGARWTDWVRPVPFIEINDYTEVKTNEFCDFRISNIDYIQEFSMDTAIIVDLPSYNSIKEGIGLAKLGFRPIPIYNGTNEQEGSISNVSNHAIERGLIWGASELNKIKISNDAPPAFLLDSNRMNRYKMDMSVFDNSWDIYPQDIPSSEFFIKNGINKIVIRGKSIQKDLNKILYKFQKEGIKIFFTEGYEEPREVILKKTIVKKND